MLVAGVDIGNNSTEVALAEIDGEHLRFLASGTAATTGIKGTPANVTGVRIALEDAVRKAAVRVEDIQLVRLNEATPVIADVAMEAITETIITESTMIGHNPATPGGVGLGVGTTVPIFRLGDVNPGNKVIVIIPGNVDYEEAARAINNAWANGMDVQGAIVQKDDGVLVVNRLQRKIPVVDEVTLIEKVPQNMLAAVEVAEQGYTIMTLSNPFGIATVFGLTPEETKNVVPMARALIGNRSAVVIRTPAGDVQERRIPAGKIILSGRGRKVTVDTEDGAEAINRSLEEVWPLEDAEGTPGTNVGGLFARVQETMADVTGQSPSSIHIQDILAVNTLVQQKVKGGLADEFFSEDAVALAAMVRSSRLPMEKVARKIEGEMGIRVEIAGVEANMAALGALTTPGVSTPLAILDLGGGSTDAAFVADAEQQKIETVHLAGAGEMVNILIATELGLPDRAQAEDIKCYPLAKVESLFSIRLEDGTVRFYEEPLDPRVFARVVILKEGSLEPLPVDVSLEKVRMVRREAKKKVFVYNALRALAKVAPAGNIRFIDFVVLVGGSALDFEVPEMISEELAGFGIVVGRANVRGTDGPCNAVATGLVLAGRGKR